MTLQVGETSATHPLELFSQTATSKYKYLQSAHELLKNATILQSDYPWLRRVISTWSAIINLHIFNGRPVLAFLSLFSKSHSAYKDELTAIDKLSPEEKQTIIENTFICGGETEEDYNLLVGQYKDLPDKGNYKTETYFHKISDSLDAARTFKAEHPDAKIAITSFANAVRVGGADSTGGKGSQEESLLRHTYLRLSLEEVEKRADPEVRKKTGRYLKYYGAVLSEEVPTIGNPEERFGYISVAAPDLRRGIRSEGKAFNSKDNPELIKEVLHRKLSVVMMAAAIRGFDVLDLGAFGCGAFGNDPKMVAEVIKDLVDTEFKGIFAHIILPIGTKDRCRSVFEEVFPQVK